MHLEELDRKPEGRRSALTQKNHYQRNGHILVKSYDSVASLFNYCRTVLHRKYCIGIRRGWARYRTLVVGHKK